jgi:hypothetical protein
MPMDIAPQRRRDVNPRIARAQFMRHRRRLSKYENSNEGWPWQKHRYLPDPLRPKDRNWHAYKIQLNR